MKNFLKGLLSGVIIVAIVSAVPVFGDNISVAFNQIRINMFGIDQVQWGQNFTLADGTSVPYSILYNGTTYLPMRQLGNLLGMDIYWNGDSRTASVTAPQDSSFASQTIATKADAGGNVWTYFIFATKSSQSAYDTYYLAVKDETRGYERVYQMGGYDGSGIDSPALRITDDGIYFLRVTFDAYYQYNDLCSVYYLPFLTDADSQDGTELAGNLAVALRGSGNAIFDGDYLYYLESVPGNGAHGVLHAINYMTGDATSYKDFTPQSSTYGLTLSNDEGETVLSYTFVGNSTGWEPVQFQITVNKTGGLSFGTPQLIAAD